MSIFTTYQASALRTEKPLPTMLGRLRHAALGLITESGEITTEVKRHVIYGKPLDSLGKDGKTTMRQHIGEEIGDVYWYVAIAADALQLPHYFEARLGRMRPRVFQTYDFEALSLELAGEVGAFADAVSDIDVNPFGVASVLDRLCQHLIDIATGCGLDTEEILAANIAKLQERFPDAYSNEAAEARADKGGLDARNS
jgi:NTP pyrophosphatase (non-canonical NTP hydrolase)